MVRLRTCFWSCLMIATGSVMLVQPAASCSRGPAPQLTEAELIERAMAAVDKHDFVFEMTIMTTPTDTPRRQQCREYLENHETACGPAGSSSDCEKLGNQFMEFCQWEQAVRFQPGRIWRGGDREVPEVAYFAYGGFHRQLPDGGGSCIGTLDIRIGDKLVFCGSLDSEGALQGGECPFGSDFLSTLKAQAG